jgi:hypothetical protein
MYSMILITARFVGCVGDNRHYPGHQQQHIACLDQPSQLLSILGLVIEAILFGMFTSCMMFDQFDVIHSKMTHIDRLKGAEVGGSLSGVIEVFGVGSNGAKSTRFRADWVSPFAKVCFPPLLRDEVMGFCRCVNRSNSNTSETEMTAPRSGTTLRSIAEIV